MSGGPEAFAVTGGRAATTHDTDPSKTPPANTDKPVPVRVTPGILTAAEIEKLNLDVRNLDASLVTLDGVSRQKSSSSYDAGARAYLARKSNNPALKRAGDIVGGAIGTLRKDLKTTVQAHLRAPVGDDLKQQPVGDDFERQVETITNSVLDCARYVRAETGMTLREDAVQVAADITRDLPPETRAMIIVAKTFSVPEYSHEYKSGPLELKLRIINDNYEKTSYAHQWGSTTYRSSVENPPEVREAIRANPDYKTIVSGLAQQWVAYGNRRIDVDRMLNNYKNILAPEIWRDLQAAVAKNPKYQGFR
jgi:hypothetical protein